MNAALSISRQVRHLPIDTAQHPRRFEYSETGLWAVQNSQVST
jgi:hypothetical protein